MFETYIRPLLLTLDKNDIYVYDFFGSHLNDNDFRSFLSANLPIKFNKFDAVYTLNSKKKFVLLQKHNHEINSDIKPQLMDITVPLMDITVPLMDITVPKQTEYTKQESRERSLEIQYNSLDRTFYNIIRLYVERDFDVFMAKLDDMEQRLIVVRNNATQNENILNCNKLLHNIHTVRTTVKNNPSVTGVTILNDVIENQI